MASLLCRLKESDLGMEVTSEMPGDSATMMPSTDENIFFYFTSGCFARAGTNRLFLQGLACMR
jgi:hypothetical protein